MSHRENIDPSHLRQEYERGELLESAVSPEPFAQFATWFAEAEQSGILEPNAMTLATADTSGAPSARIVLLKEIRDGAFFFYTNYLSRKGKELDANPCAAMVFFWAILERQVRIEGRIERGNRADSEKYFHSRPRKSQIGAFVSRQSEPIASRAALEQLGSQAETKYVEKEIPLPDFWGGYRLIPSLIEFWQGRTGRLHDRIIYTRQSDNSWQIGRLQP